MKRILLAALCATGWSAVAGANLVSADIIIPTTSGPGGATSYDQRNFFLERRPLGGPGSLTVALESRIDLAHWQEWSLNLFVQSENFDDWSLDVWIGYAHEFSPGIFEQEHRWSIYPGDRPGIWNIAGFPGAGDPGYPGPVDPLFVDPADPAWDDLAGMETELDPGTGQPIAWFETNPAWITLEFRGHNAQVQYAFTGWCIPEPAGLALLALGGAWLVRKRYCPSVSDPSCPRN